MGTRYARRSDAQLSTTCDLKPSGSSSPIFSSNGARVFEDTSRSSIDLRDSPADPYVNQQMKELYDRKVSCANFDFSSLHSGQLRLRRRKEDTCWRKRPWSRDLKGNDSLKIYDVWQRRVVASMEPANSTTFRILRLHLEHSEESEPSRSLSIVTLRENLTRFYMCWGHSAVLRSYVWAFCLWPCGESRAPDP